MKNQNENILEYEDDVLSNKELFLSNTKSANQVLGKDIFQLKKLNQEQENEELPNKVFDDEDSYCSSKDNDIESKEDILNINKNKENSDVLLKAVEKTHPLVLKENKIVFKNSNELTNFDDHLITFNLEKKSFCEEKKNSQTGDLNNNKSNVFFTEESKRKNHSVCSSISNSSSATVLLQEKSTFRDPRKYSSKSHSRLRKSLTGLEKSSLLNKNNLVNCASENNDFKENLSAKNKISMNNLQFLENLKHANSENVVIKNNKITSLSLSNTLSNNSNNTVTSTSSDKTKLKSKNNLTFFNRRSSNSSAAFFVVHEEDSDDNENNDDHNKSTDLDESINIDEMDGKTLFI